MFEKILVPLDGSQLAESALPVAYELIGGGSVTLLRVPVYKEPPPALKWLAKSEDKRAEEMETARLAAARYLKSIRQYSMDVKVKLELKVIEGDAASVIVDTANAAEVDLIVMSTHGRTGFKRWMLGSVTEKVLRSAIQPVLAIREAEQPRKILIPLDGSELAEEALAMGMKLGRAFQAAVTLLHVREPLTEDEAAEEEAGSDERQAISQYLQGAAERAGDGAVDTAVLRGHPAQEIVNFIERNAIDLVVMSSHGSAGQQRWTYGSVTEKVLHGADAALCLVRPQALLPSSPPFV